MATFVLIEVAVRLRKRRVQAQGIWHIPPGLSADGAKQLTDKIMSAVNEYWRMHMDDFGPGSQGGYRQFPLELSGELAEAALRECQQFPVDSVERLVDHRILKQMGRGNRNGEGTSR